MAVVSICSGEWGWVKEFKKEKKQSWVLRLRKRIVRRSAENRQRRERERRGESKPVSSHYTWRRGTKKRFKCFFEEISQRNEIFFRVVFLFQSDSYQTAQLSRRRRGSQERRRNQIQTQEENKMLQGFVIGRRIEITSAFFMTENWFSDVDVHLLCFAALLIVRC